MFSFIHCLKHTAIILNTTVQNTAHDMDFTFSCFGRFMVFYVFYV